ncbi:hypothetical protein [Desulfosarcina variabilis]|uniref:hypothetical protein n=1 Tax=Desulfosarcina variabilis TaxID=2300 RepID=UPI003AFA2F35
MSGNIPNQIPLWVPIICVLLGSGITLASSIVTTIISKRSEERRHTKTLLIGTAFEHWKQSANIAIERSRETRMPYAIYPIELYITHMALLSKALENSGTNPKEIADALKEVQTTVRIVKDNMDEDSNR